MVKCVHNECQWPECDKTCGLVPTGDYEAGSSAEEGLIYHLQHRVDELLAANSNLKSQIKSVKNIVYSMDKALYLPTEEEIACAKVCLYKHSDCIYNPEYLRRHYTKAWIRMGMPTECKEESCYYDK